MLAFQITRVVYTTSTASGWKGEAVWGVGDGPALDIAGHQCALVFCGVPSQHLHMWAFAHGWTCGRWCFVRCLASTCTCGPSFVAIVKVRQSGAGPGLAPGFAGHP